MNFQKLVLTVATVILICMMILIGYAMSTNKGNMNFPPSVSECPDYWISSNKQCINNNNVNLGDCKSPMNFNISKYMGHNGNCQKVKWANNCKIVWSGLTNDPKLNNC